MTLYGAPTSVWATVHRSFPNSVKVHSAKVYGDTVIWNFITSIILRRLDSWDTLDKEKWPPQIPWPHEATSYVYGGRLSTFALIYQSSLSDSFKSTNTKIGFLQRVFAALIRWFRHPSFAACGLGRVAVPCGRSDLGEKGHCRTTYVVVSQPRLGIFK